MSPSENDLRAALRAGDDEPLNVDAVVAGAERYRRARRTRVLSVTAAVVVVAGLATALPLVSGGNGGSPAGGDHPSASTVSSPTPSATSASSGGSPQVLAALAALRCPTRPSQMLQPGGGGTTQFGGGGPLFAMPVAAALVCEYDSSIVGLGGTPGTLRLSGADAAELAASLDDAADQPVMQACPDSEQQDAHAVSVQALTANATKLPLVSTTVGEPVCRTRVTNGTALRYGWTPPQGLAGRFAALHPGDAQPAH